MLSLFLQHGGKTALKNMKCARKEQATWLIPQIFLERVLNNRGDGGKGKKKATFVLKD